LLETLWAWPFDQVDGEVSSAQLGDEIGGDHFPGAGFRTPDPMMLWTILQAGHVILVDHWRAFRVGLFRTQRTGFGSGAAPEAMPRGGT
jgi:hypothetical protein